MFFLGLVHHLEKSGEAVDEATRQYFSRTNNLMPVNTISQLGADVKKMADRKYESIRAAQNYLYDDFEEFAAKLGDKKVISLVNTIKQAQRTFDKFSEATPGTSFGPLNGQEAEQEKPLVSSIIT